MPSRRHQSLVRLLTEIPQTVVRLIERVLGLSLPGTVEPLQGPATVHEGGSEDFRADGAVVVRRVATNEEEMIVVEVQLAIDRDKDFRWPMHVAGLRNRVRCPTVLVVVTDSEQVAQWAATPIDLGRALMMLQPLVIGPQQIPREIDPQEARRLPILAVMAVVAHGRGPDAMRVGRLAIDTIRDMAERGEERVSLYMDVVTSFLDEGVLREIEEDEVQLDADLGVGDFAWRHYSRGREEGLAAALLVVLEARGFEVSQGVRDQIEACHDDARLKAWLRRVPSARSLAEVLDERSTLHP